MKLAEFGMQLNRGLPPTTRRARGHRRRDHVIRSGAEPFDPLVQDRLPSDEYLDDLQQGLTPGGSEPRVMDYDSATHEMPVRQSLIDTMRQDMDTAIDTQEDTSMSPERAPAPILGFSYDYTTDEPPTIQRIAEAPMHSSPYQEPPKLRARAVPALVARRPRSTSVPPIPTTVAKMAKRCMPVTEEVTPPISPARADAPSATPSLVQHPGRGRGRGRWRAQSTETPGVGTRSKTRQAEAGATQAQATRTLWPGKPDKSLLITRMMRDLRLQDPPEDKFRTTQRRVPAFQIDENQNEVRPPAAGIHSHHRDVFIIPPPRARWWRCGGIDPSEHGSAGVDPPCRPITCGTAPRGSSLFGSS